jgi:hypothetical protein
MNYIYFQKSTEPLKIGDLTESGLVTEVYFPRITTTQRVYEAPHVPESLLPMLIIDAPDNFERLWKESNPKMLTRDALQIQFIERAIPFADNTEVWNWLQSKGIKPEVEGLYEFNARIDFQDDCQDLTSNTASCSRYRDGISCKNCIKILDIKPLVQEESEEDTLEKEANFYVDMQYPMGVEREYPINDFKAGWERAKKYFKIERRK